MMFAHSLPSIIVLRALRAGMPVTTFSKTTVTTKTTPVKGG